MTTFFRPYEGKRPYVFVSYSHRDSERVLGILSVLNERKLRLWYDEGIPAGSDWPKSIEQHMRECSAVVFFLSGTALSSPNCRLEISTARQLKKPLLVIPLDGSEPDEQWSGLLSGASRTEADPEAVLSWEVLTRSYYRKRSDSFRYEWIGLAVASALLIGAAVFLAVLMRQPPEETSLPSPAPATATPVPETPTPSPTATPTPTEDPPPTPTIDPGTFPVTFPDAQQETAVRMVLDMPEGDILRPDLAGVTELYFCGSMTLTSSDGITFDPDGTVRANGAPVIQGKVSDLSVIRIMAFLERLALVDQPLGGVPSVYGLLLLNELYLSGSDVTSLIGLSDLPRLRTLHIEHTDVKDLSPLAKIPSLETVTVSADMLPLTFPDEKSFRVILVP